MKWSVVLGLVAVIGCHRMYRIDGRVVVAGGVPELAGPALLCVGHGGATGGVYGRPASTAVAREDATIFCAPTPLDVEFALSERIYAGALPRRAHVYAWLAAVPAAAQLCGDRALVTMDRRALAELVPELPCDRVPARDQPMAVAVTFDPEHKTWTEAGATWTEQRELRITRP